MTTPHPVSWIFLLAVVAAVKLVLLVLLCRRLRRAFPAVWDELGRPFSIEHYAPRTSMSGAFAEQNAQYGLLFFIFSGRYRDLHDRMVACLVWSARFACLLIAILLVLTLSGGWPQPARYKF